MKQHFTIKIEREGANKWRITLMNGVSHIGSAIKDTASECLMYAERMNDYIDKN